MIEAEEGVGNWMGAKVDFLISRRQGRRFNKLQLYGKAGSRGTTSLDGSLREFR
jgi:hypothetical protein